MQVWKIKVKMSVSMNESEGGRYCTGVGDEDGA